MAFLFDLLSAGVAGVEPSTAELENELAAAGVGVGVAAGVLFGCGVGEGVDDCETALSEQSANTINEATNLTLLFIIKCLNKTLPVVFLFLFGAR